MSKSEVKAAEARQGTKLFKEDTSLLVYKAEVGGFDDTLIIYTFVDDKLVRANYGFSIRHSNSTDYISDFQKIKSGIIEKYGDPSKHQDQVWKNDLYKDDEENWGTAIGAGHLVYQSKWDTKSTVILETLRGDNFEILLGVQYLSKEFGKLEEREKSKKLKTDF